MNPSILYALAAAALFGASTPLAKQLGVNVSPVLLAGLLYLGSGLGLTVVRFVRDHGWKKVGIASSEWPWLIGAIAFGGVLGPVALMFGLTRTSGATASLMLNLEAVLTALLAWVVFKENADRRIVGVWLRSLPEVWSWHGLNKPPKLMTCWGRWRSRWPVCAGASITT